jgi:hypothetical protein
VTQAQPHSAPEAPDPYAEFREVDIATSGRGAACAEDVMQMAKAHLQTQIGDAVGFPAGMVAFHSASRDLRLFITLRQVIAERKAAKARKIEKRRAKAAKALADAAQAERDAAQAAVDAEKAAHRARLDHVKWETFELIDAFGTPPEATEGECKATMERLERLEREQETLYLTLPPHVLAEKVCKHLKANPAWVGVVRHAEACFASEDKDPDDPWGYRACTAEVYAEREREREAEAYYEGDAWPPP